MRKREAYEAIRAEVVHKIRTKVWGVVNNVKGFFDFVQAETGAFKEVMAEYGQLRDPGQMSYKLDWDGFRIWIKCNKVKRFDERADVAASRLIEFLQTWIQRADNGANNPMYQLAMTLLERNKFGDLDYKSISKLYELENKFNDPEYSEIMQLFKESNVVEGTATNYYFEERDERGVWRKLEPSFNRL
ncbi:MAG: DUF3164 family protein [Odoribacter sp.]